MIGVKSRAFNGGRGGAGSALRAAPSGTPAAPRPPSARHRPTIRCLRQSLWLMPALPANPLTTNYQFCRIPSLTTRGTLSVSHFRGRVHSGKGSEKRRRGDCRRVIRDSRRQAADDAPPVVSFCRGSGNECCHCCQCCQFQYQFPIENWQHWYWQQFHIGNIYKTRVSCLASHVPRLYFGARR